MLKMARARLVELAVAGLLAVCLALLKGRYLGIGHDSLLYLGQVLEYLYPESLQHDLFFIYGSQASFTVFPWLVARLAEYVGYGAVFIWLSAIGLGAFWFASWGLVVRLLPGESGFYGLLALLLLPSSYGAWEIFHYAEPFLTGRTFAEPLSLFALMLLVSGRCWVAAIVGLVAVAMHPLQALPAGVVAWLWLAAGDRRWLHALWALAGTVALGALAPQWHFLFDVMDAQWRAQVMLRSAHVFLGNASVGDWYYLLTDMFVVAVAFGYAQGVLRRYLGSVLVASIALVLLSLLLVDALHLAWPARLQLWRVHWLLHWSAMMVLPWLGLVIWSTFSWRRIGLFACVVALGFLPGAAHPLTPGIALLYLAWPRLEHHLGPGIQNMLVLSVMGAAFAHVLGQAISLLPPWQGAMSGFWLGRLAENLMPIWLVPAVVVGIWLWRKGRGKGLLGGVLIIGGGCAFLQWDGRPPIQRDFTDMQPQEPPPFGVEVAPDAQLLWLGEVLPVWSVMKRPSYISSPQMAGIVFSRRTSMEAFRRKEQMHVRDGGGRDCRLVVLPDEPYTRCKPDEAAIRNACGQAGGALAFVVLPYRLRSAPVGTWVPSRRNAGAYHLYACKNLLVQGTGSGE
ncbi:hypothetical protein H7691_14595 [Stenotrophomonas sp. CW117]|uniref:hypothetical protein n=1 Tax=Stenotrophomonas TaxID=40323 RepID=UPI000ADAAFFF|nr:MULTISPECIES: hypothetical protein [Stenotrophomonas]QOF97841.1 hypothetical protein H7691_14595 [Stenotrophomonas sp. CW117]